MSEEIATPKTIWIITEDTSSVSRSGDGSRSGGDEGGVLGGGEETTTTDETVTPERKEVDVSKLKQEMQGFLQAMREILDEAEQPSGQMQLDEVQLSVEINGEGQISLFGIGGKTGGKGAINLKFKRKES